MYSDPNFAYSDPNFADPNFTVTTLERLHAAGDLVRNGRLQRVPIDQ